MKVAETVANLKYILLAPTSNILNVAGVIFVGASFCDYSKQSGFALHDSTIWTRFIVGAILITLGIGTFYYSQWFAKYHSKLDFSKGVDIKRNELAITIKKGEIQNIPGLTQNSAIVLPANSTFVDDCVTDNRTATGAYFIAHFPKDVGSLPQIFLKALSDAQIKPGADHQYPYGTTILLPDNYSKPAKILMTASTRRTLEDGITSTPHNICSCVESIFKRTVNESVDTLNMPILGSGHGGVDRGMALLFLVLAILHYGKAYHHIKCVNILIHPSDVKKMNSSTELQLLATI